MASDAGVSAKPARTQQESGRRVGCRSRSAERAGHPASPCAFLEGVVDDQASLVARCLLALLHRQNVDFTSYFRALSSSILGDSERVTALFPEPSGFDKWSVGHRARLSSWSCDPHAVAAEMDRVNPVYIPRNHQVEEALTAASDGNLGLFRRLLDAVSQPFDERPGLEPYAAPAPPSFGRYRTFCGT